MSRDVDEALDRARTHLRRATVEGLEAARALLDVAMRSAGVDESARESLTSEVRGTLEELLAAVRSSTSFSLPSTLATPLLAALDAEIARWERLSATDPTSRPVLRAFLAFRELLWELGVRQEDEAPNPAESEDGPAARPGSHHEQMPSAARVPDPAAQAPPRVQRFDVE